MKAVPSRSMSWGSCDSGAAAASRRSADLMKKTRASVIKSAQPSQGRRPFPSTFQTAPDVTKLRGRAAPAPQSAAASRPTWTTRATLPEVAPFCSIWHWPSKITPLSMERDGVEMLPFTRAGVWISTERLAWMFP